MKAGHAWCKSRRQVSRSSNSPQVERLGCKWQVTMCFWAALCCCKKSQVSWKELIFWVIFTAEQKILQPCRLRGQFPKESHRKAHWLMWSQWMFSDEFGHLYFLLLSHFDRLLPASQNNFPDIKSDYIFITVKSFFLWHFKGMSCVNYKLLFLCVCERTHE